MLKKYINDAMNYINNKDKKNTKSKLNIKNKVNIILILIIMLNLFTNIATATQVRTRENLLVSDKNIVITEGRINDILNTPAVDAKLKVYDFIGVLSDQDKKNIYNAFLEYITKTNMDLLLVIEGNNNRYSSNYGDPWEVYADDFFDYNDFGIGSSRDGMIFLVDMKYRKLQVSTSGKAQLYYPNDVCLDMIDKVKSFATDGDFLTVALEFVKEATKRYESGIPKSQSIYDVDEYGNVINKDLSLSELLVYYIPVSLMITSGITIIFVLVGLYLSRKPKKSTNAKYYLKKGSFVITNQSDNFITSNTTKTKIETSSSSGSRIGGSGRSHGGGSRGF